MILTFDRITDREREIVELTAQGYICKEIASQFGLSCYRVNNVRSRLIRCLGYRNATQMAVEYIKFRYGHR